MSRGGRGAKFQGGRPRGPNLPFDVDPELLEAVDKAEDEERSSDEDLSKELYPDPTTAFVLSAPVTAAERRGVQLQREIQAKRRAGPFWTGTREQWAEIDSRTGGQANAFDSVPTYGKKRAKKPFQLANLKRVKVCYPHLFPKELRDVVSSPTEGPVHQRKILGLAKKSAVDKLAKFDDDEANAEVNDKTASEDEGAKDDEEDFDREPVDDDFDEDEEELDNDYNAEKYFDDGEDDFDDGEGEEYGDDGY